jgi:hypothetical protein
MTQEFRREAIANALASYSASGATRTETIEYRGVQISLEVITINPEVPLLNPDNSRLRAQLLQHPLHSVVATNPTSPEAQKILAGLLASTEKFDDLKKQLLDFKQQEPGLVSREGLLVNGNTRLTAIRELGLTGFDVAVLPADATNDDFFDIEMSLQLRNLVHQDYTFTNQLLLVDSHLRRTDHNEKATINAMQWRRDGLKKLRLSQGHLGIIEEIRSMNPQLKYEFFDKRAEFIKNLFDEYTKLSEHSPAAAEHTKLSRILALLVGLNKDEIREIDEDFLEDLILPNIDGGDLEEVFAKYKATEPEGDVLDDLLDESSHYSVNLKQLVLDVANSVIDTNGAINDGLIDQKYKKLHATFKSVAREKRESRVNAELRSEPIEYLKDVTNRIQDLADRIPVLVNDAQFESGKFSYQAKKTSKAIAALQDALIRAFGE